ncbi:MAG: helix-hairpin-helix domain-containing protein [Acidobacteria bacterium]|nr:helix-hairpin-helix domain-containing protein [Acidobacteriota bacterium]
MAKRRVDRIDQCSCLEDLPNVGKATAADLRLLGIEHPAQLTGRDPEQLYRALCEKTGFTQDPCVLDVFRAVVAFAEGGDPRPWWAFTPQRRGKK